MGSEKSGGAGNQQESLSSEEQRRWFLAGVIEGEGSVYVGIKSHATVPLGFFVQPGFSITQHRIRRSLLEMAMDEFSPARSSRSPGTKPCWSTRSIRVPLSPQGSCPSSVGTW